MSTVPSRFIQAAVATCLNVPGFRGFAVHKPTNTISVWVPSLDLATKLQTLNNIQVSQTDSVQVQAYLAAGTDLKRYVISGVDYGETPEQLRQELSCSTHEVVAVRYMGTSRTCLVTLRGPPSPPDRIVYYGCILRPRPFKPSVVYCYSCYRQGHMKSSCPYPPKENPEEATTSQTFRCGLCKSNDHDITSRKCPTKLEANKKVRERRLKRSERHAEAPVLEKVPIYNRYAALTPLEEDFPEAEPEPSTMMTYSSAVKMSRARRRRSPPVQEQLPLTDLDEDSEIESRLDTLEKEIQRLKERRAILQRRRASTRLTDTQTTNVSVPPGNQGCTSNTMSPRELLCFVVQQLQTLTSVLMANLRQ